MSLIALVLKLKKTPLGNYNLPTQEKFHFRLQAKLYKTEAPSISPQHI